MPPREDTNNKLNVEKIVADELKKTRAEYIKQESIEIDFYLMQEKHLKHGLFNTQMKEILRELNESYGHLLNQSHRDFNNTQTSEGSNYRQYENIINMSLINMREVVTKYFNETYKVRINHDE